MNHRHTRAIGWALSGALILGGTACDLEVDEAPPRGPATSQRTMASIGNSLTAGFQSSGIQEIGQRAAFPQLMAQRILGDGLVAPFVLAPGIGSTPGFTPLFIDELGNLTADPLPTEDVTTLVPNLTYPIPFENLGVPGATTEEMLGRMDGSSTPEWGANPFFDLILRNSALPGGGTVIEQIERIEPQVITLWTGNNEVLGGATSGSPQNTDPTAPGYVYPVDEFEASFLDICDRVEALNPEMVAIANVPPVGSIPFVRYWSVVPPLGFGRWNMEEDCDDSGCDPEGTDLDSDPAELVLLPAGTMIADCTQCLTVACNDANPCTAIPASLTLSSSEVQLINDAIDGYNAIILREATARGWAHVDANAEFLKLPTTSAGAGELNTAFPWDLAGTSAQNTRSAFTLDGVHPSEKGHAYVANLMLDALNATYGTSYEGYDITAIDNVAGFENAPRLAEGHSGTMTANAAHVLDGMIRMFNPRF